MEEVLRQTKDGFLIPKRLIEKLSTKDLAIKATNYYILIQPKNMTKLTKGMLRKKPNFEVEEEVYRMFEDRNL